jgi:hypothetical protein
VGEWLKPTDCKSVPPSEVRRFESFPVHQLRRMRFQGFEVAGLQSETLNSGSGGNHETLGLGTVGVSVKRKFVLALIAYAVLGILAWTTLSDEAIQILDLNLKLRTGTLLILGLFAFKSALFFWRTRIEEERGESTSAD